METNIPKPKNQSNLKRFQITSREKKLKTPFIAQQVDLVEEASEEYPKKRLRPPNTTSDEAKTEGHSGFFSRCKGSMKISMNPNIAEDMGEIAEAIEDEDEKRDEKEIEIEDENVEIVGAQHQVEKKDEIVTKHDSSKTDDNFDGDNDDDDDEFNTDDDDDDFDDDDDDDDDGDGSDGDNEAEKDDGTVAAAMVDVDMDKNEEEEENGIVSNEENKTNSHDKGPKKIKEYESKSEHSPDEEEECRLVCVS